MNNPVTTSITFDRLTPDPVEELKQAVGELHKVANLHAEGMKHMADALIGFDARLRGLEKRAQLIKRA